MIIIDDLYPNLNISSIVPNSDFPKSKEKSIYNLDVFVQFQALELYKFFHNPEYFEKYVPLLKTMENSLALMTDIFMEFNASSNLE